MRCLIFVLGLLLLGPAGCGSHREAAKAAEQARQANAAVGRDMVLALEGQLDVPTITGGTPNEPYVLCIDLHYQSTGLGTKGKSPDFYA